MVTRQPSSPLVLGIAKPGGWLSGRSGALLGALSFPIYLTHLPVICSIGAACYLTLYPHFGSAMATAATLATIFLVTFAVSIPLMTLDRWWLRRLRALERKIVLVFGGLPGSAVRHSDQLTPEPGWLP
jgi:peptidoglycan/LPS O-acetylase OafA/YrhL